MGRFHLRKYCYLVLWAALLAAVAGVWFFGREPEPPEESGLSPAPQASAAPSTPEEEGALVGVWVPYFSLHTAEHTQAGLCGKLPDHRPNRPGEGDQRPVCPRAALLRRLVPLGAITPGPTSSPAPRARTRALTPWSL